MPKVDGVPHLLGDVAVLAVTRDSPRPELTSTLRQESGAPKVSSDGGRRQAHDEPGTGRVLEPDLPFRSAGRALGGPGMLWPLDDHRARTVGAGDLDGISLVGHHPLLFVEGLQYGGLAGIGQLARYPSDNSPL